MASSDRVVIRIALALEADGISTVLGAAFEPYRSLYTSEAYAATTPTPEEIQHRWNEGPVWVAASRNGIAGTVSAVPRGEDLYIRSMAVLPSFRGKGIGKLLLREIERYARMRSFRRLILSTTPFLLDAIRLYENFGFQHSEEGPDHLFGTPLFTMTRRLKCVDSSKSGREL